MKICILANPDSVHTRRWVTSLCSKKIDIVLISLNKNNSSFYDGLENFSFYSLGYNNKLNSQDSKFKKLKYLFSVWKIKKIISREKPDILHAHYASSYGLVGALCSFHPYIISVWGSDIFDFPRSSALAKWLIKYSLSKADKILSTSHAMAEETKKYCNKIIEVTPFGVDLKMFYKNRNRTLFGTNDIVIGTIKTLEKVYGIEYLIEAFAKVSEKLSRQNLKLLIVGSGSCETEYKNLVKKLGIEDKVLFSGFVEHTFITEYYNNIDIFVVPSLSESFGVSVLEASACELPVIVTDTGGLPEVVDKNVTGLVVPVKNAWEIAKVIELLIFDEKLRAEMGEKGRKRVTELFDWKKNVQLMIKIYNDLISKK